MTEIQDFFIDENTIEYVSDDAYKNIKYIIEDITAISRITYKSIYVIDYYKKNFLFVSDNPFFLCGMTAEEVQKMGYKFYINQVTTEDLDLLLEINVAGFKFAQNIPTNELRDYSISCDFHIVNNVSKKEWLVNHHLTPLRLTENGKVWLALCIVSIPPGKKSGNIVITNNKTKKQWKYNRVSKKWKEAPTPKLKDVEIEVLKLSAIGYTMQEIADEVNRSFDAVKVYRKSLFKKLGVDNIIEAINLAQTRKII